MEMGVYHTVEGEEHVSASERLLQYGELGAELKRVDADEIDEEILRCDDRREGVRDVLAEEMEGI